MDLRRAQAADEAALAQIRRSAILALAVPILTMEQAEHWAARVPADRISRAIRAHEVWVALKEEAALGWIEIDRDHVAGLYVAPMCARQGIGSLLLTHAEHAIFGSGYATAQLEASQNALSFYLQRGYLPCGPPNADHAYPLSKALGAVGLRDGGISR